MLRYPPAWEIRFRSYLIGEVHSYLSGGYFRTLPPYAEWGTPYE